MDDKTLLEAIGQMMDSKLAAERESVSRMIDSKLEPIHADIQGLKAGQDTLQADVSDIKERLNSAEEHLAKVAVTQENLVLPKIDLLAEGHGEIIDRLKALKGIESEQEEHDRRIWVLEQAIRAK